jgi:hypothetical protein
VKPLRSSSSSSFLDCIFSWSHRTMAMATAAFFIVTTRKMALHEQFKVYDHPRQRLSDSLHRFSHFQLDGRHQKNLWIIDRISFLRTSTEKKKTQKTKRTSQELSIKNETRNCAFGLF